MCLNLVKSQKVLKIFEKLFVHVMLMINCGILVLKNFQFENLDLYHLPAHCAWASRIFLLAKKGDDRTRHCGPALIYDWLVPPGCSSVHRFLNAVLLHGLRLPLTHHILSK